MVFAEILGGGVKNIADAHLTKNNDLVLETASYIYEIPQ
jgi:hypothetical protein